MLPSLYSLFSLFFSYLALLDLSVFFFFFLGISGVGMLDEDGFLGLGLDGWEFGLPTFIGFSALGFGFGFGCWG